MKRVQQITAMTMIALLGLTSCQSEIDEVNGDNPNTNNANSSATTNFKRTAMFDGSVDDFIDGNSCSAIMFPAKAIVNGTTVTLFSELDYQQVITILGQFNNDQDSVVLQFPLTVKTSNYTEVTVNNQTEYNAILDACSSAEASGEDAISSVAIDFPITILTYDVSFQQTGSVVITSKQELYAYMTNISSTELYAVKYPMSVTLTDGTKTTVASDAEFKATLEASLKTEATMTAAANNVKEVESVLVNGMFKVESYVNAGVETTTNYKDFTVDFANDKSIKVISTLNTVATGTYEVSSQLEVLLKLNFTGNTSLNLLNNDYKVTSFNNGSIILQSSTNAAIVLVLKQI
ncbi:hypothetical protein HNQ02_003387 [Flavobacterium sp. 7E]|uniref:hypothetical protein n=1 Tax=unclassified Flavobacterium TaxID=196869 RepID=UPI001570F70E|nr:MULTISPECIES: hypothetical protein [unclassified Flavobacterium]NRS90443.1 hypothetical protein [Flavobacterium sp. 7E]NRT16951.1 hypothetical protein [Flavobacterium sp. 28A]